MFTNRWNYILKLGNSLVKNNQFHNSLIFISNLLDMILQFIFKLCADKNSRNITRNHNFWSNGDMSLLD